MPSTDHKVALALKVYKLEQQLCSLSRPLLGFFG